jgi:hypothetical protein
MSRVFKISQSDFEERLAKLESHPLLFPVSNHTLNLNNNPNYIPPSGEIIYTSTKFGEYEDWIDLPFRVLTTMKYPSPGLDSITISFDTASVSKKVDDYLRVGDLIRIKDVKLPIENVYINVEASVASILLSNYITVRNLPDITSPTNPITGLSTFQQSALIGERIQLKRLL